MSQVRATQSAAGDGAQIGGLGLTTVGQLIQAKVAATNIEGMGAYSDANYVGVLV